MRITSGRSARATTGLPDPDPPRRGGGCPASGGRAVRADVRGGRPGRRGARGRGLRREQLVEGQGAAGSIRSRADGRPGDGHAGHGTGRGRERDPRGHGPHAVADARREAAAGERRALAHPGQAVADRLRGRRGRGRKHGEGDDARRGAGGAHRIRERPAPHRHRDAVRLPRELDLDGVPDVAVAQHVGEGLLHDPVHGELLPRTELARLARLHELDGEARGAHLVDEVAQLLELGLRGVVLAVPELRQEDPHVAERLPRGGGDGAQRLVRGLGIHQPGVPGAVGLRDHDGERVGDDVVHVPRDPVALLLDDHVLQRAGLVALGGLLRVPAGMRRAGCDHEAAGRPRRQQHAPRAEEEEKEQGRERGPLPRAEGRAADGDAARRVGQVARGDHAADDRGGEAQRADDAASVRRGAVHDARDGQVAGLDARARAHLDDRARPRDGEGEPGRDAAHREGGPHDEHEDDGDLGGCGREHAERARGRDADRPGGEEGHERDGEDDVEDELVPRDPSEHATTVRAARARRARGGR